MVSIVPMIRQLTDLIKLLESFSFPMLCFCVFGFKNMRSTSIFLDSFRCKYKVYILYPTKLVGFILNFYVLYLIVISKKCKYALKALLYISKNSGGKAILTSSIAQDENIPRKFLESILRSLRNNQILHSKRGKEGGFLLLRDPKEIYIVEIMRIMDGPVAMLPCVSLNYYQSCEECDEKNCAIKGMFETIRDKTLEVLGGTSLHDLNQQ